ncbi:hypothetical protein EW026_g5881 [Hermanssonia centrifuga]|uniref:Uncharacterized protein n=1 Tax=Hermanssonia centrifuga TaxID=98765 RepID=A0A4S4KCY9_9APHY|nr:hypothetical protein EW026_g5881 [Hermanssonia centrifuga]
MSAQLIVASSLSDWAEAHIKAIFQATKQEAFDEAFEAFFAKHTEITVNGKKISRAQYKEQIGNEKGQEVSATVHFPGVVEVPASSNNSTADGIVAVFTNATVYLKEVDGRPNARIVTASHTLVVVDDPSVPHPPHTHGGPDRRRVSKADIVLVQKSAIFN